MWILTLLECEGTRTTQQATPSPNLDEAGPIVLRLMGLLVAANCDTAQYWTRICSDASSTVMQCLRPLCLSGGSPPLKFLKVIRKEWFRKFIQFRHINVQPIQDCRCCSRTWIFNALSHWCITQQIVIEREQTTLFPSAWLRSYTARQDLHA